MANFARGLQAGLPVGLALGEGFRERRERRAYQEAAQQWTPEESELNLGDAPISGGAPPMARGIGPQMSPEDTQAVETQRLTAPPGTMPRSQTQRRFTLPGAPGEMYGTEAEASQAARVRGLEAQRQAAMQMGDIDAANRLASSIHAMEQDEQRTALAVSQDERAQAAEARAQSAFDRTQADQNALDEFMETTAGMSSEERLLAVGEIGNSFVRRAVIDEVAAELGITSTQANIRLTDMQMSALEDEIQRNDAWGAFFSENADLLEDDPQSFIAAARASGNPDFAARANEVVRGDVALESAWNKVNLERIKLAYQQKVYDEDRKEWAEVDRINREHPDPESNLQARLNSEVLAVRVMALEEALVRGELDAQGINIHAQKLELEAVQQTAAINRAHRAYQEAGGTDINVFFDSLDMGGEPVQIVEAEDSRGRTYFTLGRDTNGDGEADSFLNFQGNSLDGLYQDVLRKFSSPEATLKQLQENNRAAVANLSNSDLRQMATASSDLLVDDIMRATLGTQFFALPEGMQEQQLQDEIDRTRVLGVVEQVRDAKLEGVETGQWNSRVTASSVADWIKSDNMGYDPETDAFFVQSPTNPNERIPAEIFRPGSSAREAAIELWRESEAMDAERARLEGGGPGIDTPSRRLRSRDPNEPFLFDAPGILRGAGEGLRSTYIDPFATGGWRAEPEPEQDMADGGLVKASGESAKGEWRERVAAGIRANQQAQRSMEGEVAPSAPLAYQPLNDMSAMDRLNRSRVQAPRNMADGGIARKDMRGGGDVSGPGTETSDSIPARLSDGEYVLNAETVKMVGEDYLDKINNAGLRRRDSRKRK